MLKAFSNFRTHLAAFAAATVIAFSSQCADAETPVGSNIDSRVILAFKIDDGAAQAPLPDGWRALTLPQGPLAGANQLVVFIDRHLQMDPDGKPATPYASRSVAIVAFGVSPDVEGARTFVTRVYETPPIADSYGNGAAAAIARLESVEDADGARAHRESWTITPESGGTMTLNIGYKSGRPGWSQAEMQPYSSANPDFFRIYRYEQLVDLAMSKELGKPLDGAIDFSADMPDMPGFDGSEELKAVMVVPVYVREVSLP